MTAAPRLQHFSSGSLALLVHGLFSIALMVGVSWKNLPQLPVEADLWSALPEPPPVLELEPLPEPVPEPTPPPAVEAPKPGTADIALEKAREQEKKRRADEARQEELKLRAEERARLDKERLERERVEKERSEKAQEKERQENEKREQKRRQMEQELDRQMQEDLDAEATELRTLQERARAERQASTINDFKQRIQVKIQSYVRLPPKLAGNPEAEFRVNLLPNGEVSRVTLVRSSGQPAYDVEVERAILKASPLPLPNQKEIAAAFRDDLTLKFRPFEEGRRAN